MLLWQKELGSDATLFAEGHDGAIAIDKTACLEGHLGWEGQISLCGSHKCSGFIRRHTHRDLENTPITCGSLEAWNHMIPWPNKMNNSEEMMEWSFSFTYYLFYHWNCGTPFWNVLHVFITQASFYLSFRRHSSNRFLLSVHHDPPCGLTRALESSVFLPSGDWHTDSIAVCHCCAHLPSRLWAPWEEKLAFNSVSPVSQA